MVIRKSYLTRKGRRILLASHIELYATEFNDSQC